MPANIEINNNIAEPPVKQPAPKAKKQAQPEPVVDDKEIENLNNQIELENLEQSFNANKAGRPSNIGYESTNLGILEQIDNY